MLFKLAWRNLWRKPVRTLITAASVFFAVLLAIIMRSIQEGSYEKMIENVVSFYTGYAQIHKEGYWDDQTLDNSFEIVKAVQTSAGENQDVEELIPRIESFALASAGEVSQGCLVVGIDPQKESQLTNLKNQLVAGAYLKPDSRGAMVANGLAEKLGLGINDTIVLISQGYHGVMAAGKYPISGLIKFGNPDLSNRMVYLPIDVAQEFYGAENRLTSWALLLDNPKSVDKVVRNLKQDLGSDYEVMNWEEMMPELVQLIEADRGGGVLMMGILYLIIAFGMFGTVLMMTAERKYEFGVLTAIGMKKRLLAATVSIESILISIMGVIGGAIGSLPFVYYLNHNPIYLGDEMADAYAEFGMEAVFPAAIDPAIFWEQAIIVLIFAAFVAIYPAVKVMQIKPVEAMRV